MKPFRSVGLSNETEIVSIFKVTIDAADLYDSKTGNSYVEYANGNAILV